MQGMSISKVAACFSGAKIRKVDNRINLIQKQENAMTTNANPKVTVKPVAATLTIESKAYLILQSNNMTRIAEERSKS